MVNGPPGFGASQFFIVIFFLRNFLIFYLNFVVVNFINFFFILTNRYSKFFNVERIILSFYVVKGHLNNFIILHDMKCHLNSIFHNSNILIGFYWSRNT